MRPPVRSRIKAEFPNADRRLWPGQFVERDGHARAPSPTPSSCPRRRSRPASRGLRLRREAGHDGGSADDRRSSGRSPSTTVVENGLKPDETVVTDGQLRLIPGTRVTIKSGPGAEAARRSNHEPLRALHQAAGHDDARSCWASWCSARWRTGCCRSAICRSSTFRPSQVQAGLPGANPETMATAVALPLEKQFSAIAGLTSINSSSSQGQTQHHAAVRPEPQHRRGRADVQAMIARTTRALPPHMPAPPSLQKNNPTDQSRDVSRPAVRDAAAVDGRRVRADDPRAAHLDGERRRAGQRQRLAESRRAHRRRPAQAWRHTGSASTRSPRADHERQRQPADRHDVRRRTELRRQGQRAAAPGRRHSGRSSSRTGTAIPSASTRSRTSTTASRTTSRWRLVQGRARDLPGHQQAAGHQRRRRSSTASRRCCPTLVAQLPAAADARRPRRSLGDDSRVGPRREADAAAHGRPRRPGHLPVPAERVGDHHSQPGAAGLDRRHLRGDVPARLQPRQPVADGADALGRIRRRRRDRDAREHRAAHGDGQVARCRRRSTARRKSRSRSSR